VSVGDGVSRVGASRDHFPRVTDGNVCAATVPPQHGARQLHAKSLSQAGGNDREIRFPLLKCEGLEHFIRGLRLARAVSCYDAVDLLSAALSPLGMLGQK
jgi:hypothetical protein